MAGVITLLTDFGASDHYVAAMKGQIIKRAPGAALIDISHDIPPGDLHAAAYLLAACRHDFPSGTVHLAVVDPGVGGRRRAMALRADDQLYVGPDNGIFTLIARAAEERRARKLTRTDLFNHPVSATFHGRDIFAPIAAALAGGLPFEEVGAVIDDHVELDIPSVRVDSGRISGSVLHIDRFGNIITSITEVHLRWAGVKASEVRAAIGDAEVFRFSTHYDVAGEGPFLLIGSGGYLECSVAGASAASILGVSPGESVEVRAVNPSR